ncbi:MAG: TetR/AcrR family transcriptional regulator [Actinomycetota bacterium]
MAADQQSGVARPVTKRGQATLRALLDAAEEVFGEYSYDRASVSEITRRAGVAQGTFYVYFDDKQSAFVQLVKDLNRGLRRHIATAIGDTDDRLKMERIGLTAFFEYTAEHRSLYKIVRESEFVDEDIYRWHYETLGRAYARGLRAAMEADQISDEVDPDTLAWVLMGISELLGSRWVILERSQPSEEILDEVMGFIRRGFGYCDPREGT